MKMRKIKLLMACMLIGCCAGAFTSCSSDDEETLIEETDMNNYATQIVGTWRMDNTEEYWRFDAAGSGNIGYGENWDKADDVNEGEGNAFQWNFEKNGLMVIYKLGGTYSDPEPDAPYIIRSITSTHMTWTTNNGKGHDESFTKVK